MTRENWIKKDITAPMKDNQTWNTCPKCGHEWCDEVATPGLIHRTRLCDMCKENKYK